MGWVTDGVIWPRWMSSVKGNKSGNGMVLPGGSWASWCGVAVGSLLVL